MLRSPPHPATLPTLPFIPSLRADYPWLNTARHQDEPRTEVEALVSHMRNEEHCLRVEPRRPKSTTCWSL
ncbi:hypothetical protein ACRALDRAFT_1065746 [Sodiomyces alcalophilus JCM 7366]|uniref:uncharacterized protein n=1 Tax=Sodiomyces alcalophilus JCM 7366 TaxID=591952 RepID=UPI0039B3DAE2